MPYFSPGRTGATLRANGFDASDSPGASGMLAWNMAPMSASGTKAPAAATIYMMKIIVPYSITVTNLTVAISTAGTSYTNTQLGLYSSAGVLLGSTAVLGSAGTNTFGTTGAKTIALGTPVAVQGGASSFVWGAIHAGTNSATSFVVAASSANSSTVNLGMAVTQGVIVTQTGHATNDLATIGNLTPASNVISTVGNNVMFIALS